MGEDAQHYLRLHGQTKGNHSRFGYCLSSAVTCHFFSGATREYFSKIPALRDLQPFQYEFEFEDKREGVSCGCVCIIKILKEPTSTERYFIKTYQDGPLASGTSGRRPPHAREVFVYNFLESIHVSEETHFIVGSDGSLRSLYIAMKEVKYIDLSMMGDSTDIRYLCFCAFSHPMHSIYFVLIDR